MSGEDRKVALAELKRLAQAATPGPWVSKHHGVFAGGGRDAVCNVSMTTGSYRAEEINRDFIAAANPATILGLIEQVEEVRRVLASVQECDGGPDILNEAKALEWVRRDDVREELEEAKSDNAALRDALAEVHTWVHMSHGRAIRLAELLAQAHPGDALLARINGLEAALRKHARRVPCPACGGIGSRTCATCDNGEKEHLDPEVTAALEGKS